ncbi:fumarylacetoacetase [Ramlibacter albus]|uniref:fumarylacetoacetase n=1 Tax=Ramlibacter albus TaxID=2079448 RepID=A0A923M7Y4_9BURK|nr:fumarylacetoacetase [Ramlibacter albus]MBC5765660.1 fumarylacetoacetase [Ramlibacter albus]
MTMLDETHDPALRSWVESANDAGTDFPIQNLPFGRFRRAGSGEDFRVGVAIGDQVLDLRAAGLLDDADLKPLMASGPARRRDLRARLSAALREGSAQRDALAKCLVPQAQAEMAVPCTIGDYTDFYTGIHHATAVGKLFRPDNPLLPNYEWVPIGYHGRSSSIVPSGTPVRRPRGQTQPPGAAQPVFGPCQRLDYEVELGFFIGTGNAMGQPVSIDDAEEHLFGVTLFNDWSARDIQAWEYQPLGPFLSKNFGSTISPWVVTLEALAPFRAPLKRPAGHPDPLPHLDSKATRESGSLDIRLETWIQTEAMRKAGQPAVRLATSNAADAAFWTPAQLVAHHTCGGCNLQPGDLFGSGTLSGPSQEQSGSLLELTKGGKEKVKLPNGEERSFLQDGDALELRGVCERPRARRIGFGACAGMIVG